MSRAEGAAPQDRPDRCIDPATVLPATSILLQHALASGDPSVIDVVRRIVEGRTERQAASLRARRERLFDADTIERLEMDDRRREAARRLPRLCAELDVPHRAELGVHHQLGCHDPLADAG